MADQLAAAMLVPTTQQQKPVFSDNPTRIVYIKDGSNCQYGINRLRLRFGSGVKNIGTRTRDLYKRLNRAELSQLDCYPGR
jgi:hypothetical protein